MSDLLQTIKDQVAKENGCKLWKDGMMECFYEDHLETVCIPPYQKIN
jgi:hypothetical protein